MALAKADRQMPWVAAASTTCPTPARPVATGAAPRCAVCPARTAARRNCRCAALARRSTTHRHGAAYVSTAVVRLVVPILARPRSVADREAAAARCAGRPVLAVRDAASASRRCRFAAAAVRSVRGVASLHSAIRHRARHDRWRSRQRWPRPSVLRARQQQTGQMAATTRRPVPHER